MIKICTVLILLLQAKVSVWKLSISVEGGSKHPLSRSRCGCYRGTAAGRTQMYCAEFFNTSLELKSSYICTESFVVVSWKMFIAIVTRSWCPTIRFSFYSNKCNPLSVFFVWNPVVFRSYYNVNVAKSGTVLDELSVKMYIFFKVQVVIWETLRACYNRSRGGYWDFRFRSFGYFLDRFSVFVLKNFGFSVLVFIAVCKYSIF